MAQDAIQFEQQNCTQFYKCTELQSYTKLLYSMLCAIHHKSSLNLLVQKLLMKCWWNWLQIEISLHHHQRHVLAPLSQQQNRTEAGHQFHVSIFFAYQTILFENVKQLHALPVCLKNRHFKKMFLPLGPVSKFSQNRLHRSLAFNSWWNFYCTYLQCDLLNWSVLSQFKRIFSGCFNS